MNIEAKKLIRKLLQHSRQEMMIDWVWEVAAEVVKYKGPVRDVFWK